MKLLSFLGRWFRRKEPQSAPALPSPRSTSMPHPSIGRLGDEFARVSAVIAIFGEEGIKVRAFGLRGIFLPLPAAEEVARRLEHLSEIESRGYL